MKIRFNGAANDVTGSQFVLEINGQLLMIDCGMYQGPESYERNNSFRFKPREIDAVILTHAHIDHSGNLPTLVKKGYEGPIYATPATADLADLMLQDSGHIQEDDAEEMNERRKGSGQPPYLPLYTSADAARVKKHFVHAPYGESFEPIPGVTAVLYDAGHILGSASICLDISEQGRAPYRAWFSGDIGRLNLPLLKDPTLPKQANLLVMESTYGDTVHPNPDNAYALLSETVAKTVRRGGKVIIPAFSVGRTQELVYDLNRMISEGEIPPVPVFVDSPLAVGATQVFQEHPELFDKETYDFIRENRHPALNFKGLVYVEDRAKSKAINEVDRPCVIISASGMAENGRILHHLVHNIEDSRNTILIVGWAAPGTLGRALAQGAKEVRIFGDEFKVNATVVTISGFSAHAGQDMLLDYALATKDTLQKLILTHGDPEVAEVFTRLLKDNGIKDVVYPQLYESIEF